MTDCVKNQPGPSTIVKNTNLWPTSFTKPEKQTSVCIQTYIFKDSNKVQRFLKFLKEKFPDRKVDVKQLDNGNVSVNVVNDTAAKVYKECCYASRNGYATCCVKSPKGYLYYWGCCFSRVTQSGSIKPAGTPPHCFGGTIKNTNVTADKCSTTS